MNGYIVQISTVRVESDFQDFRCPEQKGTPYIKITSNSKIQKLHRKLLNKPLQLGHRPSENSDTMNTTYYLLPLFFPELFLQFQVPGGVGHWWLDPLLGNILFGFIFSFDKLLQCRVHLRPPEAVRDVGFVHCSGPTVAHLLNTLKHTHNMTVYKNIHNSVHLCIRI